MLQFLGQNQENSSRLYAVEPNKLSHQPPSSETPSRIVRVEFDQSARRIALRSFVILIGVLLLWSWLTELDDIAQAPGRLVPGSEVQPAKASFNGKITQILVQDGQHVKRDDILMTLDATAAATERDKDAHELTIAEIELRRHRHAYEVLTQYLKAPDVLPQDLSSVPVVAEAIGQMYASLEAWHRAQSDMSLAPAANNKLPQMRSLSKQQLSMYDQEKLKRTALTNKVAQFNVEEDKSKESLASVGKQCELQKAAVEQKKESLRCAELQLAAYEKVAKSGASSRTECLDARIRVEDAQRELTQAQANYRQLNGQLESLQHELAQLKSLHAKNKAQLEAGLKDLVASGTQINLKMRAAERSVSATQTSYRLAHRYALSVQANELTEISVQQNEVSKLQAKVRAEQRLLEKCSIHAPVDGIVALMQVQGAGQVVQEGETLVSVVPTDESLRADIYVPNQDAAFIHKGERITLQFPAYPYQQYGSIGGKITEIDAFPSQDKEHPDMYRMFVLLDRNWIICQGRKILLKRGLDVEAQLVLRKKRLLLTWLAPLLKLQYSHFKG